MQPNQHQTDLLKKEIEELARKQSELQQRIDQLAKTFLQFVQEEPGIEALKSTKVEEPETKPGIISPSDVQKVSKSPIAESAIPAKGMPAEKPVKPGIAEKLRKTASEDFEKFIGENIISKIGIVILVIGVGIGTKYAIDRDLLSPLTRIILGYILGAGVLGFGIKTREKYENFSAILVSGAMAIFYLITFAAFSFYHLIPQALAFGLMVVFTAFTVMASMYYNRQWISLLALVGGYGVPFLLSNNTGRVDILFGYMLLLNSGILVVAIKRYWHVLYLSAFALSWIIMLTWLVGDYNQARHFSLTIIYSTLFFLLFYAVFLVNKLVEKKTFGPLDVIFLLINSFIYFGIGYDIIDANPAAERFTGLFTLFNALIHFSVALLIYRMKLADRNLFFMVSGLVLVFITLAIPVQFDGGWVTLTWAAEAALLFWIGRSQKVGFYEWLSYPLMVIAFFSQIHDWSGLGLPVYGYYREKIMMPFLNISFVIASLVCIAYAFLTYISLKQNSIADHSQQTLKTRLSYFFGYIFPPAALLLLLFFTFRQELIHFWELRYASKTPDDEYYFDYYGNTPVRMLLKVWILNYAMAFIGLMGLVNTWKIKSNMLAIAFLVFGGLVLVSFMLNGLPQLGSLRDSALHPDKTIPGITLPTAITLRYLGIASALFLLLAIFLEIKRNYIGRKSLRVAFDLLFHLLLINMVSHELVTWLKINAYPEFDKLGLSIIWGLYSLVLIGLGIFKQKKHLRIAAIALFGITLLKLFFYDLAHLTTIAKTIVFIALGILLLTISFLYNKYKNTITDSHEK